MSGELLKQELKKTNRFDSLEQEVFLNVQRTADALARPIEQWLKGVQLTGTQYNVLRILRGAGPDGLTCGQIADRMVTRDPDMTRLLDRLDRRGLVIRQRGSIDRRVIHTRITPQGLSLLAGLDEPLLETHRHQLCHLGPEQLRLLSDLLEWARDPKSGPVEKTPLTQNTPEVL